MLNMQSVSDYLGLYWSKVCCCLSVVVFPSNKHQFADGSERRRTHLDVLSRALGDETSGRWGDGTSISCYPEHIPPSISVYRDCFHLREAIFLSNSLQKLTQITIILIIDHHITLLK